MVFKSFFSLAALVALVPAKVAAQSNNNNNGNNLLDMLSSNDQTSQFYTYLSSTNIASQLQNASNSNATYTVFAPANSAFTPQVVALLSVDEDRNDIILYHVVNGTHSTDQLQSRSNIVDTLLNNSTLLKWSNATGLPVDIYKNSSSSSSSSSSSGSGSGSGIELHSGFFKANVIQTDIRAGNGIIHIIDSVITYPISPSATIRSSDQLSQQKLKQFYGALARVGLLDSIDNANGITIFAPSDQAFGDLNLLTIPNDTLKGILNYHIVDAVYYSTNLTNASDPVSLRTWNSTNLNASTSDSTISVGNTNTTGKVVTPDVLTNNGVLHIIDTVLMPPSNGSGSNNATGNGSNSSASAAEVSRFALFLSVVVALAFTLLL